MNPTTTAAWGSVMGFSQLQYCQEEEHAAAQIHNWSSQPYPHCYFSCKLEKVELATYASKGYMRLFITKCQAMNCLLCIFVQVND